MVNLTEEQLIAIRDEVIEVGVDGPAASCCRNWKSIEELITAVLESDTFNGIYIRRDEITIDDL